MHGSYDFGKGMDLTNGKKPANKVQYVPHNRLDVSSTSDQTAASKEGQDSEGNEKKLHLAEGGEVDDDPEMTPFERHLRDRDRQRDKNRDNQTRNDMDTLEKQSKANGEASGATKPDAEQVAHMASGGEMDFGPHYNMTELDPDAGLYKGAANSGLKLQKKDGPGPTPVGEDVYQADPTGGADDSSVHIAPGESNFAPEGAVPLAPGQAPGPFQPASLQDMTTPGFGLNMDVGGQVPGRAKVAGNSLKNDTVPAMLSAGEVVLPRTISHDPEAAAEFVRHINARKKMAAGGEAPGGYAKVLASHRDLHNRLSALEARLGGKK